MLYRFVSEVNLRLVITEWFMRSGIKDYIFWSAIVLVMYAEL